MIVYIFNNRNYTAELGSLVWYVKGALLSFTFILAFSMGTAWSYESIYKPINKNYSASLSYALPKTQLPSTTMMNMCKSLLKNTQDTSSYIVISGNQRIAGKIAVLGIILGVRFALEPKNNENISVASMKNHVSMHQKKALNNGRSIKAVVAYRRCQKEQALNKVATAR
ncbi:MAG: hypothetical protein COB14_03475 [Alphaproteobacteria bacterium]|nr:MAG: hypothetical protein COB14_03475 [Alphaproteobacteria bacterium]